ncbi:MAG TPA: phenylacetic acid degradation protein, partial [Albitalea sp.]|nr:phenylacetic acid degradation protein [Albitalea sp.]
MAQSDLQWPTDSAEAFLALGRKVLAQQPFSGLIGAELAALAPGRC